MSFNPDFIIAPFEVLQDDRLTLRQIRVLLAILSWRNKNTNVSAISREMIAERTGYPLTRVSTITSELESLGWLKKHGNGGRSQWIRYQISDLKLSKKTVTKAVTVTETETVTKAVTKRLPNRSLNGYQNGNETVTESGTRIDTDKDTYKDTDKEKINKKEKSGYFDQFWQAYPNTGRRVAKQKCRETWKTKKLDNVADEIISHLIAMKKTSQWQQGYEPAPLTYLNQSRWEDGVPTDRPMSHKEKASQWAASIWETHEKREIIDMGVIDV